MERRISRREFGKKLATGAALLALHPSCTSTQPSLPKGQLLRNDLTDLSGTLLLATPSGKQLRTTSDISSTGCRSLCSGPAQSTTWLSSYGLRTSAASRLPCGAMAMQCLAKLKSMLESSSTPVP